MVTNWKTLFPVPDERMLLASIQLISELLPWFSFHQTHKLQTFAGGQEGKQHLAWIMLARATQQESWLRKERKGLFMEMGIAYPYTGFMSMLRVAHVIAILLKAADDDATSTQLSNFGCQFQLSQGLGQDSLVSSTSGDSHVLAYFSGINVNRAGTAVRPQYVPCIVSPQFSQSAQTENGNGFLIECTIKCEMHFTAQKQTTSKKEKNESIKHTHTDT